MRSDIEIARAATLKPIADIAASIGVPEEALQPYGRFIAKIEPDFLREAGADRRDGKLILVTAINPTPAGEGKTTTTVGLGDALNRIGKKAIVCLREPSLGPCFGMKGGAAGGGHAQVVPMDAINLHFTGDFHAITSAHNLLAAMLDNHIYWGNALGIDQRRIAWKRAIDMNDRALREVVVGLGGPSNGFPHEDGFDITVASEVMAAFCLAADIDDLERRLGRMVVAHTYDRKPVTAADLKAEGAMSALLKEAIKPNLVQTLEGTPAFVHGGPFANIAHGCNSVVATRAALKLADYVVTEAGFGADLGAEKFFDIKCRKAGLKPAAAVVVATVRALKMHGGVAKDALGIENLAALKAGLANLARHIANIHKFGVPVVVAVNRFTADTEAELDLVRRAVGERFGLTAVACDHWARGGAGAEPLAHAVAALADAGEGQFQPLYPDELGLWDKTRAIAREIYGADDVVADHAVREKFRALDAAGYGALPVCVAKTQYSFSDDPSRLGAPTGFTVTVKDVRLRAGAGFVVAQMGDIRTMPGLPRRPAAERIRVVDGEIEGLF
ncbi:formate-tetrahydrofolate ligase [Roseiarcus fermentans]|uniref:Formate--tetrahydrofolate ligase n=1 Tax=Roseiarcus fermentans TaxID=1473586 RepID=A0A366FGJ2_9HYPH|nr:formate--tetrahydrofolate ligase [Roseiarcus fermentans]RBP13802.1 formate-tetrahydrofolate ligase [Roseiarcus fermentans]